MVKTTIDGKEIEVESGTTVMQAAKKLGIEIPHFCYHDHLSVSGCCRLCMVEVEKMPKLVSSCVQPCMEEMVVHTDTPAVLKARREVMALTLANHPLDCPICDQGGECSLQDYAMLCGADRGCFAEPKRVVENKDFGPLIKTDMTRCIHCLRCIRFMNEIAGTPELAAQWRGEEMAIVNVSGQALTSELSGNLIDVCPVGALTAKPYAFRSRAWECTKTESIDVMDAVGSSILIERRDGEILRILPRRNEAVNEVWISDKARFAFDGLKQKRLDRPYLRKDGNLIPVSWEEAIGAIVTRLKTVAPDRVAALAGDMIDCEAMFAMKQFLTAIGSPHMDCRQDGAIYDVSSRGNYIMNSTIEGIEKADAILLINTNVRHEAPVINARIRKRWMASGLPIALVGPNVDLSYPCHHLGETTDFLKRLIDGKGPFADILRSAKNPMIFLGAAALARPDGAALFNRTRLIADTFNMIRDDWNGFNVLQLAAARVGGLDVGFVPQAYGMATNEILVSASTGKLDLIYLMGVDEIDVGVFGEAFVVYQGHHGDRGAASANVVLPGAAYTEKEALYVNAEGRPQYGHAAVKPVGEAKVDWEIIASIAKASGHSLPFECLDTLREKMFEMHPVLSKIGEVSKAKLSTSMAGGVVRADPFFPVATNFYASDPISRASPTMAACVDQIWSIVESEVWVK